MDANASPWSDSEPALNSTMNKVYNKALHDRVFDVYLPFNDHDTAMTPGHALTQAAMGQAVRLSTQFSGIGGQSACDVDLHVVGHQGFMPVYWLSAGDRHALHALFRYRNNNTTVQLAHNAVEHILLECPYWNYNQLIFVLTSAIQTFGGLERQHIQLRTRVVTPTYLHPNPWQPLQLNVPEEIAAWFFTTALNYVYKRVDNDVLAFDLDVVMHVSTMATTKKRAEALLAVLNAGLHRKLDSADLLLPSHVVWWCIRYQTEPSETGLDDLAKSGILDHSDKSYRCGKATVDFLNQMLRKISGPDTSHLEKVDSIISTLLQTNNRYVVWKPPSQHYLTSRYVPPGFLNLDMNTSEDKNSRVYHKTVRPLDTASLKQLLACGPSVYSHKSDAAVMILCLDMQMGYKLTVQGVEMYPLSSLWPNSNVLDGIASTPIEKEPGEASVMNSVNRRGQLCRRAIGTHPLEKQYNSIYSDARHAAVVSQSPFHDVALICALKCLAGHDAATRAGYIDITLSWLWASAHHHEVSEKIMAGVEVHCKTQSLNSILDVLRLLVPSIAHYATYNKASRTTVQVRRRSNTKEINFLWYIDPDLKTDRLPQPFRVFIEAHQKAVDGKNNGMIGSKQSALMPYGITQLVKLDKIKKQTVKVEGVPDIYLPPYTINERDFRDAISVTEWPLSGIQTESNSSAMPFSRSLNVPHGCQAQKATLARRLTGARLPVKDNITAMPFESDDPEQTYTNVSVSTLFSTSVQLNISQGKTDVGRKWLYKSIGNRTMPINDETKQKPKVAKTNQKNNKKAKMILSPKTLTMSCEKRNSIADHVQRKALSTNDDWVRPDYGFFSESAVDANIRQALTVLIPAYGRDQRKNDVTHPSWILGLLRDIMGMSYSQYEMDDNKNRATTESQMFERSRLKPTSPLVKFNPALYDPLYMLPREGVPAWTIQLPITVKALVRGARDDSRYSTEAKGDVKHMKVWASDSCTHDDPKQFAQARLQVEVKRHAKDKGRIIVVKNRCALSMARLALAAFAYLVGANNDDNDRSLDRTRTKHLDALNSSTEGVFSKQVVRALGFTILHYPGIYNAVLSPLHQSPSEVTKYSVTTVPIADTSTLHHALAAKPGKDPYPSTYKAYFRVQDPQTESMMYKVDARQRQTTPTNVAVVSDTEEHQHLLSYQDDEDKAVHSSYQGVLYRRFPNHKFHVNTNHSQKHDYNVWLKVKREFNGDRRAVHRYLSKCKRPAEARQYVQASLLQLHDNMVETVEEAYNKNKQWQLTLTTDNEPTLEFELPMLSHKTMVVVYDHHEMNFAKFRLPKGKSHIRNTFVISP